MNALFWCFVGGETPVPISNTAVKPARADDTLRGKVGRRQYRAFITKNRAQCAVFLSLTHPIPFGTYISMALLSSESFALTGLSRSVDHAFTKAEIIPFDNILMGLLIAAVVVGFIAESFYLANIIRSSRQ